MYLTKVIHADGFNRLVAVKLLHPRWSENEEIASRMRDEARLLGWLRHRNIVDVMDLTMIDGRCAVIMEFLEAVDTRELVLWAKANDTRLPLRAALEVCSAVASALDAAYNRPPYAGEKPLRVIHRDIKPSNVMVDESGLVKVLDFGVARAEFDERESKTQELAFGSLEYMPPERLFFEPESPASDVYSLGATLFELLALDKFGKAKLRPPAHEKYFEERFDALVAVHPLEEENEDILHDLLADMLAFDEEDRPSAADVVARLRSFSRRLQGSQNLQEFAEDVIPGLVAQNRERPAEPGPDSVAGMILTEDPRAFEPDTATDVSISDAPMPVANLPSDDSDSMIRRSAEVDDARWQSVKQATLAELDEPAAPGSILSSKQATTPAPAATPAPAPPVAPLTPAVEESVDETESSSRGMGIVVAFGGFGAVMLVGAVLLLLVVVGAVLMNGQRGGEASPTEAVAEAPAPAAAPEPAKPAAPAADVVGARFVSRLADTKKISVRCDNGDGSGEAEAVVAGDSPGSCTVTAITTTRKRMTAVVKDVEARAYACFEGDSTDCK